MDAFKFGTIYVTTTGNRRCRLWKPRIYIYIIYIYIFSRAFMFQDMVCLATARDFKSSLSEYCDVILFHMIEFGQKYPAVAVETTSVNMVTSFWCDVTE